MKAQLLRKNPSKCHDNHGAFLCECRVGFVGNGVDCFDINECDKHTHNCNLNGNCTNTDGSFICDCATGYDGNGIDDCVDIDECVTKTDECSPVQNCENTEVLNF